MSTSPGLRPICRLPLLYTVIVASFLMSSGCGAQSDHVTVRGKVTYRGDPLSNAIVTFFPTKGRPVIAPVGEHGEYNASLAPGPYGVAINVGVVLPTGYKEGDRIPPQKIVLPPEYTTPVKGTLQATVSPDQSEPIDFALK